MSNTFLPPMVVGVAAPRIFQLGGVGKIVATTAEPYALTSRFMLTVLQIPVDLAKSVIMHPNGGPGGGFLNPSAFAPLAKMKKLIASPTTIRMSAASAEYR